MNAISSVFRLRIEALVSGGTVVKISRHYANNKAGTRYYYNVTPSSLRRALAAIPEFVKK